MIFHNLSMDQHLWNYHIFWGSKHPFTSHFLGYFGWKGVLTHTHILSYSMMLIWFICIQWAGMGRVIELCKSSRSMGHGFANCQTSSWTSHDSCWGLLYWMIETQIREVFFFTVFIYFVPTFSQLFRHVFSRGYVFTIASWTARWRRWGSQKSWVNFSFAADLPSTGIYVGNMLLMVRLCWLIINSNNIANMGIWYD